MLRLEQLAEYFARKDQLAMAKLHVSEDRHSIVQMVQIPYIYAPNFRNTFRRILNILQFP